MFKVIQNLFKKKEEVYTIQNIPYNGKPRWFILNSKGDSVCYPLNTHKEAKSILKYILEVKEGKRVG